MSLFEEIEPLLRAVIPAAALCVEKPRTEESEAAARKAVLDAAAWFLPGADVTPLQGHELGRYALGIVLDEVIRPRAAALPQHRMDAAMAALPMLAEDLQVAWLGSMHRGGWVSAVPMGRERVRSLLQGTLQNLVSQATYAAIGDADRMYDGLRRVPGRELDLDALLEVLAEDLPAAPSRAP